MTEGEATALVNSAIDLLIANDGLLLDLGVAERAVAHQLARYMSQSPIVRPPLAVDCEYNRHLANPKRLNLPSQNAADPNVYATIVSPDIVIHERNSDAHNVLVLELKKPGVSTAYDERMLIALRQELHYLHAGHLILGRAEDGSLIRRLIMISDRM